MKNCPNFNWRYTLTSLMPYLRRAAIIWINKTSTIKSKNQALLCHPSRGQTTGRTTFKGSTSGMLKTVFSAPRQLRDSIKTWHSKAAIFAHRWSDKIVTTTLVQRLKARKDYKEGFHEIWPTFHETTMSENQSAYCNRPKISSPCGMVHDWTFWHNCWLPCFASKRWFCCKSEGDTKLVRALSR